MARRYLALSAAEWLALSWAMQQTYMDGFYTEGLLERPEPALPLDADMSVPDDVREITAAGTGYRTVEAPTIDLAGLISEMEARRLPTRKGR
jgi:hypothetical protein